MQGAFAMQAAQLKQSTTDWSQLKSAAAGGQLRMEHGVAERAAKRCEAMVATLDGHYNSAAELLIRGSAGACEIGRELGSTFDSKAIGGSNSLTSVITQHQQILTDMAATYRAAGAAFAAREQANVDGLTAGA
jgi:hypothetical protein